jgi:hypothetical protein
LRTERHYYLGSPATTNLPYEEFLDERYRDFQIHDML